MPRLSCVIGLSLVLAVSACDAADVPKSDTNFDNLAPLTAAIGKADKVVLYEGLPHQGNEPELLAKELKAKKTVKLNGFPFYADPLDLKKDDAAALTKLVTDAGSFKAFGGEKKCGGFHPDYAVEWHAGKDVYRCLVCFGCSEVKVFGPKGEVRCDMAGGTKKALEKVLTPYRKNRPDRE